jgi:hypothetical protein
MGHFEGYFEGAKTFLVRSGQFRGQKNLPNFQNLRYIGNFMSHCDQVPTTLNLKHLLVCEDFLFLHLLTKLSPYMYTAELAWTLSFDC